MPHPAAFVPRLSLTSLLQFSNDIKSAQVSSSLIDDLIDKLSLAQISALLAMTCTILTFYSCVAATNSTGSRTTASICVNWPLHGTASAGELISGFDAVTLNSDLKWLITLVLSPMAGVIAHGCIQATAPDP